MDEEEDYFLDEEGLNELKIDEVEYRIKKAVDMLREVVDIVHISVSWNNDIDIYTDGCGGILSRKGLCEHYVQRVKEEFDI